MSFFKLSFNTIKNTFLRFFLPLLISFSLTLFALILTINNLSLSHQILIRKVIIIGITLLPFSIGFNLYSAQKKTPQKTKILFYPILLFYSIAYFISLEDYSIQKHFFRLILLFLSSVFIGMTIPFFKDKKENSFWEFAKVLFLQFTLTISVSGIVFIGLALALTAVDYLLFSFDPIQYFRLWIILAGIFSPFLFLNGIPEDFFKLKFSITKGLKIFFEFILVPLVSIYVIVLYLYLLKIIVTWQWPKEGVVHYILFFSFIGIFTYFFLTKTSAKNNFLSKIFFYLLIPLLILFFIGIGVRIQTYGITINRYLVLVLGLWLTGITFYFIFSKTKYLRVIPFSLGIILLISSFGPWSAFSISEISQKNTLANLLTEKNILIDGKIVKTTKNLSNEEISNIWSIVNYLVTNHGASLFQKWFNEPLDNNNINNTDSPYSKTDEIISKMGINKLEESELFYFSSQVQENSNPLNKVLLISGYDYLINYNFNQYYKEPVILFLNSDKFEILFDQDKLLLSIEKNGFVLHILDLNEFIAKLIEENKIQKKNSFLSPEKMTYEINTDSGRIKLVFSSISGKQVESKNILKDFDAFLAFTK